MRQSAISALLRAKNTVFTFKEIALMLGETQTGNMRAKISYYVRQKALYPIRRGIYAKDANYDRLELATKIVTPAYISFETVLAKEGIVFQNYQAIFTASYLSREVSCDGGMYVFKRLKDSILTNADGLENRGNYFIAMKERALDTIYINTEYYFDNLSSIDWDRCFKLIPLYENKNMMRRLDKHYKNRK